MIKLLKFVFFSGMSFISATFALIGITGFCCTLIGGAILSFMGIASFSTFFVYNNKLLFVIALISFVLAIFSFASYKKDRVCPYCKINKNSKSNKNVKKN